MIANGIEVLINVVKIVSVFKVEGANDDHTKIQSMYITRSSK